LPDLLVQTRQVIAVEQQGHGRTTDIDRPMSVQAMADDTRAQLACLGIS
jgi:pimeloyl-ACP methyl ester carboxylesterase